MAVDLTGGLAKERDHVFAERPGPDVRDAVNVWLEDEDGAFGMRIGVEAVAEEWDAHDIWLDIAFADGRVISGREKGATHPAIGPEGEPTILGAGPLRFRCVTPFELWEASFAPHAVRELTVEQLRAVDYPDAPPMRRVAFEISLRPVVPPLVSGSLTDASRSLMDGRQGSFLSPRFEQLCRAEGWLEIDGERRPVRGPALRVKRQGVRKFDGFWGHAWQSALFPSGKAFGVNTFPPRSDGEPSFNEGFVFDGDGPLRPAKAVRSPWLRDLRLRDEDVPLVLETEDGERVEIEGTTFVACRSGGHKVLPAGYPVVQQAHAVYRWGGERTTGMIERSTLPGQMDLTPR